MSEQCVVAVYDSFAKAKMGVQKLEATGYPTNQISLVTRSLTDQVPEREELQYGDETEKSAATGAGLGGLVGLLLGTPLLTIPGIGAMLIAGPIAMGLAGALVGGFLGAMGGWGVHTDHVRGYEQQVAEGKLLVIAHGDPLQVAKAEELLTATEASEVHLHAETSADTVD
jgi:hypothetical protein